MAEGLTLDDLDGLQHTSERFADQPDWARAPLTDIYRRHGIPASISPADAAAMIEAGAENAGSGQSAWANPEERATAREAYARQGRTPAEVEARWGDSEYLLDPRTHDYMQRYGRDADFLRATTKWQPHETPQVYAGRSSSGPANIASHIQNEALDFYERSKGNPLYRSGATSANYQRWGGMPGGLMDAVSNPDRATGDYMAISETLPNFLRMQGSGETDSMGESWRAAEFARMAGKRYRIGSPAPILDAKSGASSQDISKRLAELQQEVANAQIPMAEERWQRTFGTTPPGWLADAGDFAISMLDPTALIPLFHGGKALGTAGKAAIAGTKIAGSGWVAPVVKNATLPFAKSAAQDMGTEQIAGAFLQGATNATEGARSWPQYGKGGGTGTGQGGADFLYKDDEQLRDAKASREALYDRLKDDWGVSTANDDAYNRLMNTGALLDPVERERRDRQFQPKF